MVFCKGQHANAGPRHGSVSNCDNAASFGHRLLERTRILVTIRCCNRFVFQEELGTLHNRGQLASIVPLSPSGMELGGFMGLVTDAASRLSECGEALPQSSATESEFTNQRCLYSYLGYWYALQTFLRHEKRVQEDLELRSMEAFLPLYETTHRWKNGCKVKVRLPLFPGFVFVEIDPRDRFKALAVPGAIPVVGSASGPWPLPDGEITNLRAGLHAHPFAPHPYLAVGQKARIKGGATRRYDGVLSASFWGTPRGAFS